MMPTSISEFDKDDLKFLNLEYPYDGAYEVIHALIQKVKKLEDYINEKCNIMNLPDKGGEI